MDDEARAWVVPCDDVPGLATGADKLDDLVDKLKVVIPGASRSERASRAAQMVENFTPRVKNILREAGCYPERQERPPSSTPRRAVLAIVGQ